MTTNHTALELVVSLASRNVASTSRMYRCSRWMSKTFWLSSLSLVASVSACCLSPLVSASSRDAEAHEESSLDEPTVMSRYILMCSVPLIHPPVRFE